MYAYLAKALNSMKISKEDSKICHRKCLILVLLFCFTLPASCVLYPYESEFREAKSLNGLWDFKRIEDDLNLNDMTKFKLDMDSDVIKMPVPSSFNDITEESLLRDHIGWVAYKRHFYVPQRLLNDQYNISLHFGGVHYVTAVIVNNQLVLIVIGGHIPFECAIDRELLNPGVNTVLVVVNNTLTESSLPQGFTVHSKPHWYPSGFTEYSHNCDYFDYAGINRPVTLYIKPTVHTCDISLNTSFKNSTGVIDYQVTVCGNQDDQDKVGCVVRIRNREGVVVANGKECIGTVSWPNVKLWWPRSLTTNSTPAGYLYTMTVELKSDGKTVDSYSLNVGIRTVRWNHSVLKINGRPVYLHGVGMHEDSDIRGRGYDDVILARDSSLLRWVGANSFRTSHYPYADERLGDADRNGIMVILETPACSLDKFDNDLLQEHKRILTRIIAHHRNRPSVIMWSLANEPNTDSNSSAPYFRKLVELAHDLDRTRPVTFVTAQRPDNDKAVKYMDVICVNRYSGWYQTGGRLDLIKNSVINEIRDWRKNHTRPIVVTEYGAGSISGMHGLPAGMWSEDYQSQLLAKHFEAFDALRNEGSLAGEMVWNFADFKTPQEYFRPGFCSKGLFTRAREPKSAAYTVRARYLNLSATSVCNQLDYRHIDIDYSVPEATLIV